LRVFFATSELAPLAQSGGLGDAVAGLARALAGRGHSLVLLVPAYRSLRLHPECPPLLEAGEVRLPGPFGEVRGRWLSGELGKNLELRVLDIPAFFDRAGLYADPGAPAPYPDEAARFICFARATAQLTRAESPDVLVAHDWQAALTIAVLRTLYDRGTTRAVGCVQVIHNGAFQGRQAASAMSWTGLPAELFAPDGLEFFGDLSLLKGGLVFADRIVAVSPSYARELEQPEFGMGLDGLYRQRRARLIGIANGLEVERFDPQTDRALPANFHAASPSGKRACRSAVLAELGLESPVPGRFCAVIGRLTEQKGWDVLAESLAPLAAAGTSLALLGDGNDTALRELVRRSAAAQRGRVTATIGWDDRASRRLYAAADCVLVPSRFEPCGLVQLIAQRYGSLPIAHAVGGLADTIRDGESGVLFAPLTVEAVVTAAARGAALLAERGADRVARDLMRLDVSWSRPAALWEAELEAVAREARARI
jgi:starch synthase